MIATGLQIAGAATNATGAGALTLVLPLALMVAALVFWCYALLRPRGGAREAAGTDLSPGEPPPR